MNPNLQKKKTLLIWLNGLLIFSAVILTFLISCQTGDGLKYKVQSGDTLSAIAEISGVSPDEIRQANDLTNDSLTTGQLLFLPGISKLKRGGLLQELTIIPRSAWGAKPPTEINEASKYNKITVHHTTERTNDKMTDPEFLRVIQNYHQKTKNWSDIAYHFLIGHDGTIYQGRSLEFNGAHVNGHNEGNIGIALLGNYDQHQLTKKQLDSLNKFLDALRERFDIKRNQVFGHLELGNTSCPGKNTLTFIKKYRQN